MNRWGSISSNHHKLTGGVGVGSVSSTAVTGCGLASVFEVWAAVDSWLGTSVGESVVGDGSGKVGSIDDALVEAVSVVVFASVGPVVVVSKTSISLVVIPTQMALLNMQHSILEPYMHAITQTKDREVTHHPPQ